MLHECYQAFLIARLITLYMQFIVLNVPVKQNILLIHALKNTWRILSTTRINLLLTISTRLFIPSIKSMLRDCGSYSQTLSEIGRTQSST